MNKRLTKPCPECPFRKDSLPGWLGPHDAQELHQIVMSELPFPCHTTHDGLTWEEMEDEDAPPLCAGALLFARKSGKMFQDKHLMVAANTLDRALFEEVMNVPEFYKHHGK